MGMELAMSEMPLALFSTLAPIGAGAFLMLAVACFVGSFEEGVARRIDKLTIIPLAFVVVGFICAFFHLTAPLNAFGVFSNVGSSPMSNEIVVGCIFTVVAIVCWLVLSFAKPSDGLRKALLGVTAVLGLVFCVFVGLAYGMSTIPTWDTVVVPLCTLCYGVLGGSVLGFAVLRQAGVEDMAKSLSSAVRVLAVAGAVASAVFFGVQMGMASGASNNMVFGADLVGSLMPMIVIGIILMLVAGIAIVYGLKNGKATTGYAWVAVIIVFVGILLARLCFYGVEMSVGLGI